MARYGKRVGGHIADDLDRVSAAGKNGLISEIVHVTPTSDLVTLYNRNATAYGTSPTDVTTGAAILKHVDHALFIGVTPIMVTGAPTTTTAIRVPVIKLINGPTTVAIIYTKGIATGAGSGVLIKVEGKTY